MRRGTTEQESGPAPSPLEGEGGGEGSLVEGRGSLVYGMMRTMGAWGRGRLDSRLRPAGMTEGGFAGMIERAPSPLEGEGGGEGLLGKGRGIFVYGMMMTMGVWGKRRTGFPLTTCGNDRRATCGNACTLTFVIGGQSDEGRA